MAQVKGASGSDEADNSSAMKMIDVPLTSSSTTNDAYCGKVADGKLEGLYVIRGISQQKCQPRPFRGWKRCRQ